MNTETVNELKQAAWTQTKAEISGMESRVRGKIGANAQPDEVQALFAAEVLPYVIAHLTRTEAALAIAVRLGIMHPDHVTGLTAATRGYCQAAIGGRRAFCKRAKDVVEPCEWRGEVAECGPVGVCPKCGTSPVSVLDLVAPNLPNAHTNGRFKLVDP